MFDNKPFIIAGPCSAESKEQMENVVRHLSVNKKVNLIRCGVWKPRTRPGGFEGMGEEALKWIADIKQQYPNTTFAVEVAQPEHVELCLKYGIDSLWIGARTSGNPFSMEELSASLRGTNIPLMIKNPLTPDVKLWIGAIERMANIGISDIAAVHRGFFLNNNYGYRNNPLWEIAIELKRTMPHIPIICDPSHISGNKAMVQSISQTAMDLNFNGLMIEVHPCPTNALTDKEQQLNFEEFDNMLTNLIIRESNTSLPHELDILRKKIDILDTELLSILNQRLDIVKQIAEIKHSNNLTVLQLDRWQKVLNNRIDVATKMGLSADFVQKLLEQIHTESVRIQEKIMNKK